MLIGKQRFGEFLGSPEGIGTNILADRLKRLEANGLVTRTAYQSNPPRYGYALTEAGQSLLPVLQAMSRWANTHVPGTWMPPDSFMKRRLRTARR